LQDVGIIDKNNYAAIEGFYTPIMHPGVATETPTPAALRRPRKSSRRTSRASPDPSSFYSSPMATPDYCDSGARGVPRRRDGEDPARSEGGHRGADSHLRRGAARPRHRSRVAHGVRQRRRGAARLRAARHRILRRHTRRFSRPVSGARSDAVASRQLRGAMGPEVPFNVDPAQQDELVEEISGVIAG
jgi:hypothetical protein